MKVTASVCLLLFCVALFSGCQREEMTTGSGGEVLQGASNCPDRAQFLAGKSYREYHADYMALPPSQKKCLWEDKLDHTMQFFAAGSPQQSFIEGSKVYLTVPRFVHGSAEGFEEEFVAAAKEHFSFEQTVRIFMVLHDYNGSLPSLGPNAGGNGGNPDCECFYNAGCGLLGYCDWGGCVRVGGCGVFKTTNCRGICEANQL